MTKSSLHASRRRGRPAAGAVLLAAAIFVLATIAAPGLARSAEPADANIKAAVYDLDRVAQQLPSLTPKRKANIKRLLRSLELAEERLAASPNQTHSSWLEATARLADYRTQLETLLAGGTPAPQPDAGSEAPETTTTQTPPAAPEQVPQMTSSDVSKFNRVVRNFDTIAGNLRDLDPKALHGERELAKWRGRIDRLNQDTASFQAFMGDPNVAQLAKNVADMSAAYRQIEQQSLAALAALGDIPGQLNVLLTRYTRDKLPQPLDAPYDEDRVTRWAQYIIGFTAKANEDAAWLANVQANTDLYGIEIKNALNGTIGHQAKRAIEEAATKTREKIYQPLQQIQHGEVAHIAKLDPEDTDQIRNRLLGEGDYEKFMTQIRDALAAIETGKRIDTALGQTPDPAVAKLTTAIEAMGEKLNLLFEAVLSEVRMPAAKADDSDLLSAAGDVMRQDRYGYAWERMVINSPVQSKREVRAWWSGNTVTAATYIWDQFQVATAEKVGDHYFIFYNLFHKYTSGDGTTPLDRWILNRRFQSNRILPENIGE